MFKALHTTCLMQSVSRPVRGLLMQVAVAFPAVVVYLVVCATIRQPLTDSYTVTSFPRMHVLLGNAILSSSILPIQDMVLQQVLKYNARDIFLFVSHCFLIIPSGIRDAYLSQLISTKLLLQFLGRPSSYVSSSTFTLLASLQVCQSLSSYPTSYKCSLLSYMLECWS